MKPDKGHCSVPGCKMKQKPIFRFPNPKRGDMCRKWKQAVNNPSFKALSHEHLYRIGRVCYSHFVPEDFIHGTSRLKPSAVPSVNIEKDESEDFGENDGKHVEPSTSTTEPKGTPSIDAEPSTPTKVSLHPEFTTSKMEFCTWLEVAW